MKLRPLLECTDPPEIDMWWDHEQSWVWNRATRSCLLRVRYTPWTVGVDDEGTAWTYATS